MSRHIFSGNLARLFAALADRTRLRLLNLMRDRELCVCYFVEVLRASQPLVSRHLAYMRRAGIVAARRDGKWMHYKLVPPAGEHAAGVLRATLDALARDPEAQQDLARLKKACCAPERFVRLKRAPAPAMAGTSTTPAT